MEALLLRGRVSSTSPSGGPGIVGGSFGGGGGGSWFSSSIDGGGGTAGGATAPGPNIVCDTFSCYFTLYLWYPAAISFNYWNDKQK
jgi:hypothetical protein